MLFSFNHQIVNQMKSILPAFGLLRTRLLLLTVLILCPVFALGLYSNLQQRKTEKANVQERVVAVSRLAAASQKNLADKTRQLLTTLSQHPFLVLTTDRELGEIHLFNLKTLSPDYANFGLIDADGMVFCDALRTNEIISMADRAYFQQVMERRRFSIGHFQIDPLAHEPCLNFGYPILNTNGALHRVLFASLKLSLLSEGLSEISKLEHGISLVIDSAGNILASHPEPEKWVGKKLTSKPFHQKIISGNQRSFEDSTLDDVSRLYAVSPISDGDSPQLFAVVGVPRDISFAQANAALLRNVTVMACITALALAAAWLFAQRLLLRPIKSMVSTANRLSNGDLSARTGLAENCSELNQLAHSFDVMAEKLAARQRELEEANAAIKEMNADLEQRVKSRTTQLETLNKELEAFSYSVSHDLRAPLRHIGGFAEMLSQTSKSALDEKGARYLGLITKAAKQMGALIDDLLNFARMGRQDMHFDEVDFDNLVHRIIAEVKTEEAGRQIDWIVSPLPKVHGDAAMLQQVWINLIANGVKYTRQKGEARIEIGWREEPERELIFFVKDNGAGFNNKYAGKLFGVFQRLHSDEEFEGTGIGLANVRRIIHRHSGRTWADGEVGNGATFYFSLLKHSR